MTVQIQNSIDIDEQLFTITSSSQFPVFSPENYHLKPITTSTCSWSGYHCCFGIVDEILMLNSLSINLDLPIDKSPSLNDVDPVGSRAELPLFAHIYDKVNLAVPYSGGLLAARGFLMNECGARGFNLDWNFEHCYELTFENGKLVDMQDVSGFMSEVRARENYTLPRIAWWKRLVRRSAERVTCRPEEPSNPLNFSYGGWCERYVR